MYWHRQKRGSRRNVTIIKPFKSILCGPARLSQDSVNGQPGALVPRSHSSTDAVWLEAICHPRWRENPLQPPRNCRSSYAFVWSRVANEKKLIITQLCSAITVGTQGSNNTQALLIKEWKHDWCQMSSWARLLKQFINTNCAMKFLKVSVSDLYEVKHLHTLRGSESQECHCFQHEFSKGKVSIVGPVLSSFFFLDRYCLLAQWRTVKYPVYSYK